MCDISAAAVWEIILPGYNEGVLQAVTSTILITFALFLLELQCKFIS